MSTVAIIQARLGSERFPRKVLEDIGGRPMIAHVVERVKQTKGVYAVVVAVPSLEDAVELWPVVEMLGVGMFWVEGLDEANVLSRYYECAKRHSADVILRVTGDCPLWDPRLGEQVLALRERERATYASNLAGGYRDGEDSECFTWDALQQANALAVDPADREHCTTWMRRHLSCLTLPAAEDRSDVKTSVDTLEDLERVRAMVAGQ